MHRLCRHLASMGLCSVVVSIHATAQPSAVQDGADRTRHIFRTSRRAVQPTSAGDFTPVDSWFSYGPARTIGAGVTLVLHPNPAIDDTIRFGAVEEEIVILSERQRRDFALLKPNDALTGPRALDAFQPYVPLPGATCTYKNLCYDMSQPPLRASVSRLVTLLFDNE